MQAWAVNEGTLGKPQGSCSASAAFLQLKEVHLLAPYSSHGTPNRDFSGRNRKKRQGMFPSNISLEHV